MASAIEDVGSLRGKTLNDQEGQKVGEIKDLYGIDDESNPMWITVESSTRLSSNRMIFVPLARVKEEDGVRTDNDSYAAQVPDAEGELRKI